MGFNPLPPSICTLRLCTEGKWGSPKTVGLLRGVFNAGMGYITYGANPQSFEV